jgi:hypothetical protein
MTAAAWVPWLLRTWEQLADAALPYAIVAAAITWLAVTARAGQLTSASAKAYATEQRVNTLVTTVLPIAIQPGSSPPIPETWHDLPSGINGWGIGTGGWKKYRLLAEGSVEITLSLRLIGTKADGTAILPSGSLPSGYQPAQAKRLACSTTNNALSANSTAWIGVLADGTFNISGVNGTIDQVDLNATLPLPT